MNIVEIALSQEGKQEKGQNQIKYNKWYYNRDVVGGSYPYCAVFISWCAQAAGLDETIIPKTASVKAMYEFFLKQKRFHKSSDEYSPAIGDLMIQRSNGSSHVGIVISTDPLGFETIEGNAGKGVERCRHAFNEPETTGFATPNYPPGMVFDLSRFADGDVPDLRSDAGIWNALKSGNYSDNAAAAFLGKLKQGNTRYYSGWHNTTVSTTEYGLFNWKWTGISYSKPPADGVTPSDADIAKYTEQLSDSTLSKYFKWCQTKGYSIDGNAAHAISQQFEYFLVMNPDLKPETLNASTLEQATSTIANRLGTATANDMAIVQEIYNKYAGKSTEEVNNTPVDKAASSDMRTKGYTPSVNLGMYRWLEGGYTVKEGDTLDSIAKEYNTTPQLIIWANNLDTWEIEEGDNLQIPLLKEDNLPQLDASVNIDPITQKLHTKKVEVSHPTAYVFFYGEYGKLTATTVSDTLLSDNYADYDIISISTNRQMTQDNPTFSISLVYRNNWYEKLGSNDLVVIQLQRPPEPLKTVFFGLIDDIRKSMDFSSGQPQRSVLVTGRGFSKAFVQFDISVLANYSKMVGGQGFFVDLLNLPNQSSSYNIKSVIEAYVNRGLRYKFSNGKTLKDYLGYHGTNYEHERLINTTPFTSFSGNIWNFIKELSNSPFNETFWEIRNGCPYIIHRPTPFEPKTWTALNRITIKDCDLVADNTGRSDTETFSAFQVDISNSFQGSILAFPPAFYPPYYEKYGISLHTVRSIYVISTYDINSKWSQDPTKFTQQLANFNIKNNIMENGTLTVKGSNQYKIGERVILESSNMEYYVEGVQQSFNMFGAWTTSLNVTRGIHPEDRFTPPYGACIDLTNDIYARLLSYQKGEIPDWTTAKEGGTPMTTEGMAAVQGEILSIVINSEGKGLNDVIETGFQFARDFGTRTQTTAISLHETDSTSATPEAIHDWHLKADNGSWGGFGYHLYVRKDGQVYRGRSLDAVGCHTYHNNGYTVGICLEGAFSKGENPTDAQLITLAKLVAELAITYDLEINAETIKGHREFPENVGQTSCPGNLMNYKDLIIQRANELKSSAVINRKQPSNSNPVATDQKVYSYGGLQWVWPAPGCDELTSVVGNRKHPKYGDVRKHSGLDIVKKSGVTEGNNILAASSGKVIYAGRNGSSTSGYGNLIEILHSNGFSTRYGHMYDSGVMVNLGETVQIGQVIGKIGSFGESTGPHLHFEVRTGVSEEPGQYGTIMDPLEIFTDK